MPEYKSLYRKWRPKAFTDVYGQEHITKVLQNQVAAGKVSHAYLFCGSKGTGKTTCAKILAKAVNCENPAGGNPCNECRSCLGIESGRIIDVIEMDAASNNGVDNVRDMREEAAYTPDSSVKKVYIIDEVHMMTQQAFNAFLKILEEPPPHIIFILATTEINKLPPTILSRCQRHDFKRIPPEIIAKRLNHVCGGENIRIEEKAVNLIARLSGGALRDALSILEVCVGDSENETISFEYVSKVTGYFGTEKMVDLCAHIKDGDAGAALRVFWEMYDNSMDCGNFCVSLLEMFRNIQVAKLVGDPLGHIDLEKSEAERIIEISKGFDSEKLIKYNTAVGEVIVNLGRYTSNKRVAVELMLIEMCFAGSGHALPALQEAEKNTSLYFDKYADLTEEIGKENKMIAANLKNGKCIVDKLAKKAAIYTDSELKLNILSEEKSLFVIQNNLGKFLGEKYSIDVKLEKTEEKHSDTSGIDDIISHLR
ncbi:MAG: DNA polymerase III subunit gamma/tau [Oscillospiraceae bacterium]|nr:DNA polymerase III subunit gamma/tau [Oscillospiraceae bacterium]